MPEVVVAFGIFIFNKLIIGLPVWTGIRLIIPCQNYVLKIPERILVLIDYRLQTMR
jgi:hypothetical protein